MTKYLGFQYSDLSCGFFTFQQENALAHRAHEPMQLLTCETPHFIAPALWPANSPELNLVDYQTWGKNHSRMHDVNQMKSRLIEEWEHFHQVFIDEEIRQWHPRLRACIPAHRGHFKQRLQLCLMFVQTYTWTSPYPHTYMAKLNVDTFVLRWPH